MSEFKQDLRLVMVRNLDNFKNIYYTYEIVEVSYRNDVPFLWTHIPWNITGRIGKSPKLRDMTSLDQENPVVVDAIIKEIDVSKNDAMKLCDSLLEAASKDVLLYPDDFDISVVEEEIDVMFYMGSVDKFYLP